MAKGVSVKPVLHAGTVKVDCSPSNNLYQLSYKPIDKKETEKGQILTSYNGQKKSYIFNSKMFYCRIVIGTLLNYKTNHLLTRENSVQL